MSSSVYKPEEDYEMYMNTLKSILPDLQWWLQALKTPAHRIRDGTYATEIHSDASTTGWGAACQGETASGQWSPNDRSQHINTLELLAAYFALKIFARDYHSCQILLRVDNSTAIAYINMMGGIHISRKSLGVFGNGANLRKSLSLPAT